MKLMYRKIKRAILAKLFLIDQLDDWIEVSASRLVVIEEQRQDLIDLNTSVQEHQRVIAKYQDVLFMLANAKPGTRLDADFGQAVTFGAGPDTLMNLIAKSGEFPDPTDGGTLVPVATGETDDD